MTSQISTWWQSLLTIGMPIFPYVGLVLLILLLIVALCGILYFLYRLSKRLPSAVRYIAWFSAVKFHRVISRLSVKSSSTLMASFAGSRAVLPFSTSFGSKFFGLFVVQRPNVPLWVFIGPETSGKSSVLGILTGLDQSSLSSSKSTDAIWWRSKGLLALEFQARLVADCAHGQRVDAIRQLGRFCPSRPFDGVVLVLAANRLLSNQQHYRDEVMSYSRWISEMSGAAGYRVPLYVVLTGAGDLAGFREYVDSVGPGVVHDDLSWHCPEDADNLSAKNIVSSWHKAVRAAVMHRWISSHGQTSAHASGQAMVLLSELGKLCLTLEEILGGLVTDIENRGSDSKLCGLFLADVNAQSQEPAARWGAGAFKSRLVLGRPQSFTPSPSFVRHTRRRAAIAAVFLACSLVFLGVGLPKATSGVRSEFESLHQALRPLTNDVSTIRSSSDMSKDVDIIAKYLAAVSSVDNAKLWKVLAPLSWFDDSKERLMNVLGVAIQKLIVEPRVESLIKERPELNADEIMPARGYEANRVEDLPAYQKLSSFIGSRELSGVALKTAESIPGVVTYRDLVIFFGVDPRKIPKPMWEWTDSIPKSVVQEFDVRGLQALSNHDITGLIHSLWERLVQESLDFHPITTSADEISHHARSLTRDSNWSLNQAVALNEHMKKILREADRPQAHRLLGRSQDAHRFILPALVRLSSSSLVQLSQYADLSNEFNSRHESVRQKLLAYEIDGVGRLFVQDGSDGRLSLSAEFKRFAALHSVYMALPFMSVPSTASTKIPSADQPINWDHVRLESLKDMTVSIRDHLGSGIQAFDISMRSNMARLSRDQYRRAVDAVFLQGARPLDGSYRKLGDMSTAEALRSFRAQAENLSRVAKLYKQSMAFDDSNVIQGQAVEVLSSQMLRYLSELESRLLLEDPYASIVNEAQRWLKAAADGLSLASAMRGNPKERLGAARDHVRFNYVVPASVVLEGISGLTPGIEKEEVVQRWRFIADALNAYDKGGAGGLHGFENYILTLSKSSAPDYCSRNLAYKSQGSSRSDYFGSRLALLEDQVAESCASRVAETQRDRYLMFAQWFNSNASGRLPFAADSTAIPLSTRSFSVVLEQYRSMRKQVDTVPPEWPSSVRKFFAQMDNLSVRFSLPEQERSTLSGAFNVASIFKARLKFRANREESTMTDQIIDWSLVAGKRQYGLRNSGDVFEWRIGEPIEVGFRWAANSSYTPVSSQGRDDGYSVDSRTAVFRFKGEWSLQELVRRHGVRGDGSEQPLLLRFSMNVVGPQGRSIAQAFITLEAVDDLSPLALDVPLIAPLLTTQGRDRRPVQKSEAKDKDELY